MIIPLLLLFSCSTKKNSFTRRAYHNLTCHYNGYWNGDYAYKDGVQALTDKVIEDYTKVLPVFNYGDKKDVQVLNQNMDRAIEKASIMIQRHSMKFSNVEYVKWIDDCYLLIGKAYFYKREYISARRSFKYVINEYSENDIKYEAMLWLARTYNQLEEYEKVEPVLTSFAKIMTEENIPLSSRKIFPLVFANYYILQEQYPKAKKYLSQAVNVNTKKQLVTRLKFIQAQIFQKEENLSRASELYSQVIKRNPPYEMAFQAKINMAKSFDAESGNSEHIVKILNKMLRDSKNKEYRDQIHYALSEVALKDKNDTLAIHHLRLSVALSTENDYQKSVSSLKVADLYFNIPDYKNSQAYYDTAMQSLPKEFPNYEQEKAKAETLSLMVDNLSIIQMQDSLQHLASMNESERLKIIDKIIEDYIKKEEQNREEIEMQQQNAQLNKPSNNIMPDRGGKWYFYNPQTLSFGYTEFVKKWGKRKLEDLWMLKNKKSTSFGIDNGELLAADSTRSDSTSIVSNDPKERDYYLQNIPFTPEHIAISDSLIVGSYFILGKLYKEGLKNNEKSAVTFKELISRYPENKFQLKSYYNLYKIFEEENDLIQCDFYKNLIVANYPESDYAKVILNPDFYKEINAQKNEAAGLYKKAYNAYLNKEYFMVMSYADYAIINYEDTALVPKFDYLRALSIGKVEVEDSLVSALRKIIIRYPTSSVKPLADNILSHLTNDNAEKKKNKNAEKKLRKSPYKNHKKKDSHFYVFVVNTKEVNIPVHSLKVRISDFNSENYKLRKLNINSVLLDDKHQIITVGNFSNDEAALSYLNHISSNEYVNANLPRESHDCFVISTSNYPIFYREKDVAVYKEFFKTDYLK